MAVMDAYLRIPRGLVMRGTGAAQAQREKGWDTWLDERQKKKKKKERKKGKIEISRPSVNT